MITAIMMIEKNLCFILKNVTIKRRHERGDSLSPFLFRPGGDEGYIELNFSLRKLFLPEGHTYLEELLT